LSTKKEKTTKALAQGARCGTTTNTAGRQRRLHHPGHKKFNGDASREENDARTPSSTKLELGRAFAQILCQGVTTAI